MSIETMIASKMPVLDLGAALQDATWEGEPPAPGLVYFGALYIDFVQPHWQAGNPGQYHLLIGNIEWISDDLTELERKLYEFAGSEGYDKPDDFDRLTAEYQVFNRGNHLDLGSADEHWWDESLTVDQHNYVHAFTARWEAVVQEEATQRAIERRAHDEGTGGMGPDDINSNR